MLRAPCRGRAAVCAALVLAALIPSAASAEDVTLRPTLLSAPADELTQPSAIAEVVERVDTFELHTEEDELSSSIWLGARIRLGAPLELAASALLVETESAAEARDRTRGSGLEPAAALEVLPWLYAVVNIQATATFSF